MRGPLQPPLHMLRSCGSGARWRAAATEPSRVPARPRGLLKDSTVCFAVSFVLNSCRNKPHQRCQSLSSAFRFKAKFPAPTSLSSSRNPNSPSGVTVGHNLFVPRSLAAHQMPPSLKLLSHGVRIRGISTKPFFALDIPSPTHTHSGAGRGALRDK